MKFNKCLILILLLALAALLVTGAGFAANNTALEQHDFDSYFTMKVPKGISFEKKEGTPSKNINISVNYKNYTEKINIIYAESAGAKEDLLKINGSTEIAYKGGMEIKLVRGDEMNFKITTPEDLLNFENIIKNNKQ